jgi:hypothetical protein
MTKRKPRIKRTGERMVRMAYELEAMAARLREAGLDRYAEACHAAAHRLGDAGRSLDREVNQ